MSALYAFCREVDDVADEESVPVAQRREQLAAWRADIRRACDGETPQFPVNRELQVFIRRHKLRFELFDELLKGVEMDLDIKRYADYAELEQYCYRVASVVGLLSIEIFGYQNPATRDYAIHLGKALQLTNILRDVRSDAERGRIYLPLVRIEPLPGDAGGNSAVRIFAAFPRPGGERGAAGAAFLSAGARNAAGGGPPHHGGRRIDGLGLLAAVAKAGAAGNSTCSAPSRPG